MLCVTVRFNPAYSKGLLTDRREPTSTLWLRNRARNGSDLPHFRYIAGRRVPRFHGAPYPHHIPNL
jgi:hypothetical protein